MTFTVPIPSHFHEVIPIPTPIDVYFFEIIKADKCILTTTTNNYKTNVTMLRHRCINFTCLRLEKLL